MKKAIQWGDKLAGDAYLGFVCAARFPEQEPAYKSAKWYDLVLLFVPVIGFIIFIETVEARWRTGIKKG